MKAKSEYSFISEFKSVVVDKLANEFFLAGEENFSILVIFLAASLDYQIKLLFTGKCKGLGIG